MTTLASRTQLTITLAASLAACGGGGDSPPPVIAPEPVAASIDVAGAWRDYVSTAHTWTMPGKGTDARAYELSIVMKPGVSARFPMTGSTGQTTGQSLRVAINGANSVVSDGILFFTDKTFIGITTTDRACAVARGAMSALPGASTAGASGPLFVLEGYMGCSISGQKLGTTSFRWSVQTDGALAMFCITSQQQGADGNAIATEVDCMEAAPNGALGSRAKFAISRPDGNNIEGRNF